MVSLAVGGGQKQNSIDITHKKASFLKFLNFGAFYKRISVAGQA